MHHIKTKILSLIKNPNNTTSEDNESESENESVSESVSLFSNEERERVTYRDASQLKFFTYLQNGATGWRDAALAGSIIKQLSTFYCLFLNPVSVLP